MSEHISESDDPTEALEGLQEAELDSVQGGGSVRRPTMDVETSQPDTVKKNEDPGAKETKTPSADHGEQ